MHAMKRVFKILFKGSKRTVERSGPRDDHVIEPWFCVPPGNFANRGFEPPPDAIAYDGTAQLLGDCEANTRCLVENRGFRCTRPRFDL